MTRLWQPAEPITVLLGDGWPRAITWGERHLRVTHIALHWRLRVWWRGIWRDYYKLATDDGLLLVIFYDLLTDGWYVQQVYD